ncbi:MAG: hypothetical protein AAGF06_00250 [Pseudomonadota bacterium]
MRALGQVIMRRPVNALALAFSASFLPITVWLGAAVVALLVLRKGLNDAASTALAAFIGASLWYGLSGELTPVLVVISVLLASISLRSNGSWLFVLLLVVLLGVINQLVLIGVSSEYLQALIDVLNNAAARMHSEQQANAKELLSKVGMNELAAYASQVIAYTTVGSVALARWWQSELYNPGGFGAEFKAIRMHPGLTLVLLICVVGALYVKQTAWLGLLCLPLLIVGLALVHSYVAHRQLESHWLVMFYVLMILGGGIKLCLVMLAAIDSQLDFRKRWSHSHHN